MSERSGGLDRSRFERDPVTGHIHGFAEPDSASAFCGASVRGGSPLGDRDWFAAEGWREPAICARCRREVAPVEAAR